MPVSGRSLRASNTRKGTIIAYTLPNGGTFALATAYGAVNAFAAISNASPPVVADTAHGFSPGDVVEVTSGWSKLNGRVVRLTAVTADAYSLEGIDTTNTNLFPPGGGAGSVRKVSTFVQISQIMTTTTDGGEQQYTTFQPLDSDREFRLPTNISAQGLTLTVGDDPSLPGYQAMVTAKEQRAIRAVLFSLPNNSKIYYNGYVGLNETPTTTVNTVMQVTASFSLTGTPTRYAS